MNTILNSVYIADTYFRLSKEDGDKAESDSIVNQKALVREFLKVHPDIQIYKEKVDDGYTGVNFERPAFQEMLEDIKTGRVNCVIVKDLSRFGRNYIEAGRYIEKIFPYLGVRFIAINDNIDTASEMSAADEMLIPFKNLINDAYCRDISVKVRSHLDVKRENGQYISPFAPYGYKKSSCNKNQLVVDEKAASMVRQIFKWKIEGMSAARIADKLNELGVLTPVEYKRMNGENYQCNFRKKEDAAWAASSVRRILCNEIYTGVLVQGKTYSPSYKVRKRIPKAEKDWVRCENCHEAIISAEDFELVRQSFGEDTRVAPDRQALYLFSGIVKCGYCKGNMTRRTVPAKGKKYVYLVCVENKNSNSCSFHKMIPLNKFEETILSIINLHIENIFEMNEMLEITKRIPYSGHLSEKLQENITYKESLIEKKKRYAADIYGDYKEGMITSEEYQELRVSFRRQAQSLEEEVRSLKQELEKIAKERDDKVQWAARFLKYRGFQQLTREILLNLVKEIRIFDKDRIEVVFKYQEEYEQACRYIRKETKTEEVKTDGKKE
ncbi:MAG: recombinase family protein [Lachnospiraceae bacterium]|nr:recombinase family protein [uncultured Acetatifactor sp.]MCI8286478.1 recombinase family protein [Lachnospiraceae bacterium]